MFDIGFSQLLLVMVIGLVFLGPERLPVAVKTIAGWVRALRSLAANVQNELTQELKLQELQESLKKVEEKANLQTLSPELKASMDELKEAAQSLKQTYQAPTTPDSTKEQSVKTDSTEPSPSDLAALAEADEVNDDANRHKPVADSVIKTEVPVTQPVTIEKKTTDQVNGEH
ncbi:Sec-independent protein translocase subunit TatB [Proteus hauseri]|uniref:Sec-independent protein translocase protein TatB n=1 Tax=Proteus cibi TaxID=2050966 RepID=A0ABU6EH69_9GAMM|nr:Sec-independent protein translocase protein TatB [Proteus cibi]MBG6030849.1 Sec-independent protein translocase subunit TatB [Proteus hauseri]MBS6212254.1 Sec-independent protein translocase subunit TatB [Proteus hauseri]MEB6858428.1 Sec-independent protein translocase protein TatB [Proteus cibi]MEB7089745.1 Sec-independent protein translocase protein TatB [Proteus cibi]